MDKIKEKISSLSDSEIKESILLDETDFKPGVYELYVKEAESRGINVLELKKEVENELPKSKLWKRCLNYLIDTGIILFITNRIFVIPVRDNLISPVYALLFALPLSILYYILCEYKFSRTLGKLLTGTYVITTDFKPVNFKCILKRTFSRFIPFNTWITLFTGRSIHERLSKTVSVDKSLVSKG